MLNKTYLFNVVIFISMIFIFVIFLCYLSLIDITSVNTSGIWLSFTDTFNKYL